MLTIVTLYKNFFILSLGTLNKTAQDGDGNVGKTIKLITQDKMSM